MYSEIDKIFSGKFGLEINNRPNQGNTIIHSDDQSYSSVRLLTIALIAVYCICSTNNLLLVPM